MKNSDLVLPASVRGQELRDYFMSHVKPHSDQFYKVVKPLHVFKVACNRHGAKNRIVNLVIPVGAIVYAADCCFSERSALDGRKMRASEAYVHSIVKYNADTWWPHNRHSFNEVHLYSENNPISFDVSRVSTAKVAHAFWNSFEYRTGNTVRPQKPFSMLSDQCDSGIHFFLNARDALTF
jgi:hypothetical protein